MNSSTDLGKLILRLTLGILLLLHGLAKLKSGVGGIGGMLASNGLPEALAYLVYVGEILAPAALILGIWTRPAALIVVINMLFAIGLVHMKELFTLDQGGAWALELQGFFLFTALAIVFLGSGRYGLGAPNTRLN
ncbi:MAG: DoxX family protein [Burkholderiaceae bacterium]